MGPIWVSQREWTWGYAHPGSGEWFPIPLGHWWPLFFGLALILATSFFDLFTTIFESTTQRSAFSSYSLAIE